MPLSSKEFRELHHLQRGITVGLKYFAYSPASLADRRLRPAIEALKILRNTCGSSSYVARKHAAPKRSAGILRSRCVQWAIP